MSERVKTGDRVRLTIEGVVGEREYEHANCYRIQVDSGNSHFVFFGHEGRLTEDGNKRFGVHVEILGPEVVAGQAYIDADDEILIRTGDGGWMGVAGARYSDSYANEPLRLLVPKED